ncbi:hypothetical protein [Gray Lodge virus]|uniref:Uncharacterized protein n=1 Tax=Gray Lodge virus TaxID=1272942 RepID=A0A0D3R1P7_9RHAB|nr:hypothetical protein [Gray Lodge virus]AJR28578.1 hypothetical protein [Gray Lodge virus]
MKTRMYGFLRIDLDPLIVYHRNAWELIFGGINEFLSSTRLLWQKEQALLTGLLVSALEFDHYSAEKCSAFAHIVTLLDSDSTNPGSIPNHYVSDSFHVEILGKTARVMIQLDIRMEEGVGETLWTIHSRISNQQPFTALRIPLMKLIKLTLSS